MHLFEKFDSPTSGSGRCELILHVIYGFVSTNNGRKVDRYGVGKLELNEQEGDEI